MAARDEAVLVTDPIGRVLFANAMACQLLGYQEVELLKIYLRDTCPDVHIEDNEERMRRFHEGKTLEPFERRMRRRDNSTFLARLEWKGLDDGRLRVMFRLSSPTANPLVSS